MMRPTKGRATRLSPILKHPRRESMSKKKLMNIEVRMLPNGYSLKFDGMRQSEGYMYFSKEKLLEGFMLHIGLEITEELSVENMQDFLVATMN